MDNFELGIIGFFVLGGLLALLSAVLMIHWNWHWYTALSPFFCWLIALGLFIAGLLKMLQGMDI